MKKVIILAALSLMGQPAWAQIRDFQTTRLISTGGAGVASILSTEAAILNPASSAFFDGSSFSYQSYKTTLKKENDLRDTLPDEFPGNNNSQGAFVADNSGPVKGGLAYINQNENDYKRQRMIAHAAAPIGKSSAMGFSYNYIQDRFPSGSSPRHKVEHEMIVGFTHIVDESMVLGLVVKDPTRTNPGDERATAGLQFTLAERITIIGDYGVQYTKSASEKYVWNAGLQLNIFSDFFLRAGQFYDNVNFFKGTGWGASWIGPRFGIEFAQKFSDQIGEGSYLYKDERLVDTALSAIIKF